jgi:serine/threonine-protein kinase
MEPDTFIGRTIGPYQVIEKIGLGGMSEVYKGFHHELRLHVAIKVMGRFLQSDPALTERFRREAQAAASLRHSNIIRVFDFGSLDGGHYLVMEYVEGTDLRAEMDRRRAEGQPFDPEEILHLLSQIAEALDYAHQHNVVHRDVKPGNILLSPDGQAILADFGLVMLRHSVSQATLGHTFGTPDYIAPEQAIDSKAAVPQSDLYALGAILYELVTGQPPFKADTPINLALKHISEDPMPPRHYAPELPSAVEAIILQSLAKEPKERFSTGRAMIEALRQAWSERATRLSSEGFTYPVRPTSIQPPSPPPALPPAPAPQSGQPSQQPDASRPAPLSSRRWWPLVAGLLALLLIVPICSFSLFVVLQGKNPFTVSEVAATPTQRATLTHVATLAPTATLSNTPTILPSFSPSPTTETTATTVPTPSPLPTTPPTSTPPPTPSPGQTAFRSLDSMTMRFVPGGSFLMGNDDERRESPQHEVTLNSFWIDETEVTNEQYRLCIEADVCTQPSEAKDYDYTDAEWANHPVVYVSWEQADAYCRWLADGMDWDVHLPTEAQWEMAASWGASDGIKRRYPWGEEKPGPDWLNFKESDLEHTASVGSYPQGASPYGVLDMAGNVWEWVADWYSESYYGTSDLPLDPPGPDRGSKRVIHGGGYRSNEDEVRTTYRREAKPQDGKKDLGFRCAISGGWLSLTTTSPPVQRSLRQ